jgi:hypothetical protein
LDEGVSRGIEDGEFSGGGAVHDVNDQGIVGGTVLCFEDPAAGGLIKRVCGQTVNRFGWHGDDSTVA